ncbi:MAG: hypothetical protein AAF577_08395 [Pseudomonadota bacterium]
MIRTAAGALIAASALSLGAAPTLACPKFDATHVPPLTLGQPDDPTHREDQTLDTTTGGPVDLEACRNMPDEIAGHVTETAQISVVIDRYNTHDLLLRVNSGCDSVLLVNDARGRWLFDDDSNGAMDASIVIERPLEGSYDIWVGDFEGQSCPAELLMTLEPRGER